MNLEQKIEAILFWKGEPMRLKKLADLLKVKEEDIETALAVLKESLSSRGIVLMRKEDEVTLGTNPEMSEIIESLTKEELDRDLGKAGLETLSIILYRGPIRRADIDYIRGVNSSFILRNLLVRGLVERVSAKEGDPSTGSGQGGRGFMYKPTFKLLSYLGVASINEMPEYDKVREDIQAFEEAAKDEAQKAEPAPEEPKGSNEES